MAEVPSGERSQPALVVDGALTSINDLLDRVRVAQGLVSHSEADDGDNGSSHHPKNKEPGAKEAGGGGSGLFRRKLSASSWALCIGGGGEASATGEAVGSRPSSKDGARAAEIPEVKLGPHAEKAVGDQNGAGNDGGNPAAVAAPGPGGGGGISGAGEKAVGGPGGSDGSGAAEIREVKPEAAATGSPMLPASSDKKDGSSRQPNGSAVAGSDAKKDGSTKRPKGDKLKVYNQAEKLLRDLNNINSELWKLKSLEGHFQDLQDPVKKLDWVLEDTTGKATSVTTPTLHKELLELADKVKFVKNQMPGHSALATNTDAGHNVDQETKFHDYHLLEKESVSEMKKRVLDASCFQGLLEDFEGAFEGLDRQSKLCLCCFSIFPEDAVVHKKLLVYWWIGEGLVDPQLHGNKAADNGNKTAGMGKKAADVVKKAADTAKKAADKGKKAVNMGSNAADMGKKAADVVKKVVDKGKKAADLVKKAAVEGKAADRGSNAADKGVDTGNNAADTGNKAANTGEKASDEGKKAAGEVIKTANEVLMELCSKGFIEPVLKKQKLSGFKMDRLVRYVVINIAEKLGFFSFDQMGVPEANFSSSHRACLVQNQGGYFSRRDLTREKDSGSSNKDTDKEKHPDPSNKNGKVKNMDHLHTLFNVNDPYPDFKLDWFLKLRMLNVLYLGGWQGSKGPHIEVESTEYLRGLRNMKYLKFLSLQGISRIADLPDSLCALTNLKILDLNACHHLESLPKQLGELKNLTHLDISECYLLDHIPKGLGQLYQLQVLKGFVIGGSGDNKDSCTLDDLKGLKNLRKLSISSSRDDFPSEKEVTVLQGFEHLKQLSIAWGGKSSKAEASPEEKVAKGKAAKPDQGKEKKKEEKTISIEQQGRGSNAEQKKAGKEKGADKKAPVNTAEQKDVKGDCAGSKKADKGEAEQPDASAQQSAQPPSRAQANWKKGRKLLVGLPLIRSGMKHNISKLEKLELQCCPLSEAPIWMLEGKLNPSKKLYIKGGNLRTLKDSQGKHASWTVIVLCLKYLADLEMEWTELQKSFPSLVYVETSCCPKLTYFPCNSSGVWIDRNSVSFAEAKKDLSWAFLA